MGKNWFLYLAGLAGTVVFHAYYFGWFSWFMLLLILLLPLFSFVVSILAMVRIRLTMEAPPECRRGDPVYVTLRASGGFLPMPRCRFSLAVRSVMTQTEIWYEQQVPGTDSWYVPLDTIHCGVLLCRVEKLRAYDYLGLFRLPLTSPAAVRVLVKPTAVQPERLPNLSQFLARRRRPKPGGGFSEEHEMRDYRPGDSMRDIHWKLSVKTDRTIVREAQEPIRGQALLTFDLMGSPERVDATLERLLWLSNWLLEHDVPHQVVWIHPADCQMTTVSVETEEEQEQLLERILQTALREGIPSLAERRFSGAAWRCHIDPEQDNN